MKNNYNTKNKIDVGRVDVCDIYEIGNWTTEYPCIKLGYLITEYVQKYSDESFYISDNNNIVGYVLCCNAVNTQTNDIIPLYCRKLIIYDFAIIAKAYARYGIVLINYLINFAKNNGYKCIEIKKENKYNFFLNFLNRHFKFKETNECLYYIIDNPKIKQKEKHLRLYEKDNINLEDLYYLYDLKFSVLKTLAKLKIGENSYILIDRRTGKIHLPTEVKILKDDLVLNSFTRIAIYILKEIYLKKQNKSIAVNYNAINNENVEIYFDGNLYLNKPLNVVRKDIGYLLSIYDSGIKSISFYEIGYNMNDRGFINMITESNCDDLIIKYAAECNSKANNLSEKVNDIKLTKEFNLKLQNIKRFDFKFGNPFCGIKKLAIILDKEVKIYSNALCKKEIKPSKTQILRELEFFNFATWKNKYDCNKRPDFDNAWSICLTFDNENLEYSGLDDYPNTWKCVEWFVKKYSNLNIIDD